MALKAERYVQVKAELEKMETRLFELSVEIDEAAPPTEKKGFIYQAACRAGDAVAHLRYMLKTQQEHIRKEEEIQRRLYGKPKN
jgi:hypothetical protein